MRVRVYLRKKERRETRARRHARELFLVKKYSQESYFNPLSRISYDCWLDSATLFLIVRRESRVKWKAGNLKICTKGRNVGRTKDRRRERGKGTWVEREKGREGEVKKASKLSRAIIPSWRVQRQRERTLPGIKVLQTCGKCSWGRVGRPRSNQTNRGTSVNLPAAKDYSWNSLCHAEFPVPFFFNDKIARYKVGRR